MLSDLWQGGILAAERTSSCVRRGASRLLSRRNLLCVHGTVLTLVASAAVQDARSAEGFSPPQHLQW